MSEIIAFLKGAGILIILAGIIEGFLLLLIHFQNIVLITIGVLIFIATARGIGKGL
jgi:hypothetical protein